MTVLPVHESDVQDAPRNLRYVRDRTDVIFRRVAYAGGTVVLVVMGFVALFLTQHAVPAISDQGLEKFLTRSAWNVDQHNFGILALLVGTVLIAVVALLIALPLSLGLALFVTEIARGWLRRFLQTAIDLMAAIPSLVFGLWGMLELQSRIQGFSQWMSQWFGWIPIFAVPSADPANPIPDMNAFRASTFIAACVVALMVIPIQTSIMVESFSRAPDGERESAYALGSTRWGMIRAVVLPFGQGGIIGGTMLGLGRALGETIAIYLIISPVFSVHWHILAKGGNSIAAHIAMQYGESPPGLKQDALMAAGLTLFLVTMAVNFLASAIISRSRSGSDSEG